MPKDQWRVYCKYTAQSQSISALYSLYAHIEQESESRIEMTPFVVFMAFSIEAYLNSIGFRKIKFWKDSEKIPWKTKVEILHLGAGKSSDWASFPLQFCADVFSLRDKLAHGKPEEEYSEWIDVGASIRAGSERDLSPKLSQTVNAKWVKDAKLKFRELMIYLGSLYGYHESDHLSQAVYGHETRSID